MTSPASNALAGHTLALRWPFQAGPTSVGRTFRTETNRLVPPDYPRSHGENASKIREISAKSGPSPLAWGEPLRFRPCFVIGRTIPTRVGRTVSALFYWLLYHLWTTPARVGRTSIVCHLGLNLSDHPHSRGENAAGARRLA